MRKQVDLAFLWSIFKKNIAWLLLVSAVAAVAMYIFSSVFVEKKYTSTAEMYILSQQVDDYNTNSSIISTSRALIDTYIVILQSDDFLRDIGDDMPEKMTAQEVSRTLSMKSKNGTECLVITVTTNDPTKSEQLCALIAQKAPEMLVQTTKTGYFYIYDSPEKPDKPSYPSNIEFAFVGFALAAIAYVVIVFMVLYFDNSVKRAEDIKDRLGLPILGEVPAFEKPKSKKA